MSCHTHFEMYGNAKALGLTWDEINDLAKNCPDCIAAAKAKADYTHQHLTIRRDVMYGQHIAIRCTVCGAEGTTKNISPLGCRSLFVPCSCPTWDGLEVVR